MKEQNQFLKDQINQKKILDEQKEEVKNMIQKMKDGNEPIEA